MQDLSTPQNVALVASPALAALAASAAWYSAFQNRRLARGAILPDLVIQVFLDVATGFVTASIHNAGTGAARGLHYVIAYDGQYSIGYARDGILRADEKVTVTTTIPFGSNTEEHGTAMASCRDRYGHPHSWTTREEHVVHRTRFRRRPQYSDARDRFAAFFPECDPANLTQVGATVSLPSR